MEDDKYRTLMELIAEVSVQQHADHMILESMLVTHPNPELLRHIWQGMLGDEIDNVIDEVKGGQFFQKELSKRLGEWSAFIDRACQAAGERE